MELTCTGCRNRLRVGDDAVGKRVRCPQCRQIQYVPQPATDSREPAAAGQVGRGPDGWPGQRGGPVVGGESRWRVRDARGDEYGPVDRRELDQWVMEGRLTDRCDVMDTATGRWLPADEVYPALRNGGSRQLRGTSGQPLRVGEVSDKSKTIAGLLGLFFGFLGIHRFYLGYPLTGLAMLCTAGLCGVWSLIDAILILLGAVPDSQGRPLAD